MGPAERERWLVDVKRELLRRGEKYRGIELFDKEPIELWRKYARALNREEMDNAATEEAKDIILISVIEESSKNYRDFDLISAESMLDFDAYLYQIHTDIANTYPQLRDAANRIKNECIERAAEDIANAHPPIIILSNGFDL